MLELVLLASMAVNANPVIVVMEAPIVRTVVVQPRRVAGPLVYRSQPGFRLMDVPVFQAPTYRVYRGQVIQVQRPLGPVMSLIERSRTRLGAFLLFGK